MSKKLEIFLEIKNNILNMLKKFFLLHYKNSELMDVRSFNVTPFCKSRTAGKKFFFNQKSFSIYFNVFHRKKINFFKHDEQKGSKKRSRNFLIFFLHFLDSKTWLLGILNVI